MNERFLPIFFPLPASVLDVRWLDLCSSNNVIGIVDPIHEGAKDRLIGFLGGASANGVSGFGVRLSIQDTGLLAQLLTDLPVELTTIFLYGQPSGNSADSDGFEGPLRLWRDENPVQPRPGRCRIYYEVTDWQELTPDFASFFDGLICRGNEGPGMVSKLSTFVLANHLLNTHSLPVIAWGGIGEFSIKGAFLAGCSGVVIDSLVYFCPEYPLHHTIKQLLDERDSVQIAEYGNRTNRRFRGFLQLPVPGTSADISDISAVYGPGKENLIQIGDEPFDSDKLLLVGEDYVLAKEQRNQSLVSIIRNLAGRLRSFLDADPRTANLVSDSGFARNLGLKNPLIQGPMSFISDDSQFLKLVADNEMLPVVALGGMSGERTASCIGAVRKELGGKPFGVGIIGAKRNEAIYENQIDIVDRIKPGYVIIAAGSIGLAAELQNRGHKVFLHTPHPEIFKAALDQGIRGLILEGKECGGHVGPFSSLVLWEGSLSLLAKHTPASLEDRPQIVFAGGIFNRTCALFIEGMISSFDSVADFGLQIGSAVLLSADMDLLTGGKQYREELLRVRKTVVVGSVFNLSTRTLENSYVGALEDFTTDHSEYDFPAAKIEFERRNSAGLLYGAKGVANDSNGETSVESKEDDCDRNGNYMIGDVLYLYKKKYTLRELSTHLFASSENERTELRNRFNPYSRILQSALVSRHEAREPVAIVSMGCIFPDAGDVNSFWINIQAKTDSIVPVPIGRWNPEIYYSADRAAADKTYCKKGGFVTDFTFDPIAFGIPPIAAKSIDLPIQFALSATHEAISSVVDYRRYADKTAVILGSTMGGEEIARYQNRVSIYELIDSIHHSNMLEDFTSAAKEQVVDALMRQLTEHYPEVDSDSLTGVLTNLSAGRVAGVFNFRGPNYVVDAACASSLASIEAGVKGLQRHAFDMTVCGGTDSTMFPMNYIMFSKINALSDADSCPFDADAAGFVPGEGCGVMVLKRLSDAERDGDTIFAVIRGVGSSSDGISGGLVSPSAEGQALAIRRAFDDAQVDPGSISYIECHGTSTIVGDKVEFEALRDVYEPYTSGRRRIALGSVKAQIGHLKSAAGAAGLIKTALCLHNKKLPGLANYRTPNPQIDLDASPFYVNTDLTDWREEGEVRRAGVSAFGFGGVNYHVILEEYSASRPTTIAAPTIYVPQVGNTATDKEPSKIKSSVQGDSDWAQLQRSVLQVFAKKTGYPEEMLDLDCSLEDKLGIDSVRKLTIFDALVQELGLSGQAFSDADDIDTLREAVDFLYEHQDGRGERPEATDSIGDSKNPGGRTHCFVPRLHSEPLLQGFNHEAFTDFEATDYIVVFSDDPAFSADVHAVFGKAGLRVVRLHPGSNANNSSLAGSPLCDETTAIDCDSAAAMKLRMAQLKDALRHERFRGFIYRTPVCSESTGLNKKNRALRFITGTLFSLTQTLLDLFPEKPDVAEFFFCISSLDGRLGFGDEHEYEPLQKLPSGFLKSFAKEYPHVYCKFLDLPMHTNSNAADLLLSELRSNQRDIEIGYHQNNRFVLYLDEQKIPHDRSLQDAGSLVILVTGGARGIAAEICKSLARQKAIEFVLLGSTDLKDNEAEPGNYRGLDGREIKRRLFQELKRTSGIADITELEPEVVRRMKQIEASANIHDIVELGSSVDYFSVDVGDATALETAMLDIRTKHPKVDVIIHAAGVDNSQYFRKQSLGAFEEEILVKISPLFVFEPHLMQMGVKASIFFGSIAGYFGNAAQTGYGAANDLLNLYALYWRSAYGVRSSCLNWTAWENIGMAAKENTSYSLKKAGLTFLSVENGTEAFATQLFSEADDPISIILTGSMSRILASEQFFVRERTLLKENIRDDTAPMAYSASHFPLLESVHHYSVGYKAVCSLAVSPARHSFLRDHRINELSYLPAVISLELMAETVAFLFPHMRIKGVRGVEIRRAAKFVADTEKRLHVEACRIDGHRDDVAAQLFLSGSPEREPVVSAVFDLDSESSAIESPPEPVFEESEQAFLIEKSLIYRKFETNSTIHYGSSFQVLEDACILRSGGMLARLSNSSDTCFFNHIETHGNVINPYILEGMLQCAGLLCIFSINRVVIPTVIEEMKLHREVEPGESLWALSRLLRVDDNSQSLSCVLTDRSGECLISFEVTGVPILSDFLFAYSDVYKSPQVRVINPHVSAEEIETCFVNLLPTGADGRLSVRPLIEGDPKAALQEFFADEERNEFESVVRSVKRQREWMSIRIELKSRLADYFQQKTARELQPRQIVLTKDQNGRIIVTLDTAPSIPTDQMSIAAAHSIDFGAVCFVDSEQLLSAGIDIEKIDPQNLPDDQHFIREELSRIAAIEADYRFGIDACAARMLFVSAKETLAKALNAPFVDVQKTAVVVEVTSDSLVLSHRSEASEPAEYFISWYLMNGYVFTCCVITK